MQTSFINRGESSRNFTQILPILVVASALTLSFFIIDSEPKEFLAVFVGFALVAGTALSSVAYKTPLGFLFFFFWLHLEDLVRILLGNPVIIFFVKTILFSAMIFGYFYAVSLKGRRRFWGEFPAKIPLFLFLGFSFIQAFNPALKHPLQPLIGFHTQFLYIPIFLVAYHYFDREARIKQFLIFTFFLTVVESLLTIPQMIFGPQWWFSIVGKPDTLSLFSQRVGATAGENFFRPSSIFAGAGRFHQYLSVISTILIGSLFYFRSSNSKVFLYFCLFATAIGIFNSGARTTMYLFFITLGVFFLTSLTKARRLFIGASLTALLVGLFIFVMPKIIGGSGFFIQNLLIQPFSTVESTPESGSLIFRMSQYAGALPRAINESGWTGHGLGSNSLGLYFLGMRIQGEEPGYAQLIWEYGYLGLILWFLMMGTLWIKSYGVYRSLSNSPSRPLALSILLLMSFAFIYQFIGYQIMQNYLVSIYFWTFAAMLFSLKKLEKEDEKSSI